MTARNTNTAQGTKKFDAKSVLLIWEECTIGILKLREAEKALNELDKIAAKMEDLAQVFDSQTSVYCKQAEARCNEIAVILTQADESTNLAE